jgi:hypothetical protein
MRDDRFEPVPSSGTLLRSAVAGMQPLLRDAPPALRRLAGAAAEATSRTDGGAASLQRDWHDTLLRIAVVGGVTFLAWKLLRGLKSVLWTIFGLGMALYWTGGWRLFS